MEPVSVFLIIFGAAVGFTQMLISSESQRIERVQFLGPRHTMI